MPVSRRLPTLALPALLLLGLAAFLLSTQSRAADPAATPVASPACGPVQYGGPGAAQALIVSDLPLQGDSRKRSQQMNDAIRLVLEGAGWSAGGRAIGFQACDDSEADTGLWSKEQCQSNARAYAAVGRVDWPDGFYRRDIGGRALGLSAGGASL